MTDQENTRLLLERNYLATLLGGLQMDEQRQLGLAAKRDIHAHSKLPKIREDIKSIASILTAQSNLINAKLQKEYEFQFKSFKVEDYEQIQEQNHALQRSEVPQQEGSEPRGILGSEPQSSIASDASDGYQASMAVTDKS